MVLVLVVLVPPLIFVSILWAQVCVNLPLCYEFYTNVFLFLPFCSVSSAR